MNRRHASRTALWWAPVFAVLLSAPLDLAAHELSETRVSLVQREPRHFALSLHIAALTLLQRCHAPTLTEPEVAVRFAALPDRELQALVDRCTTQLQTGFRISQPSSASQTDPTLRLRAWRWPTLAAFRHAVQQRAMQVLADPGAHAHAETLEIQATLITPQPTHELTLQIPAELKPAWVVHYRPQQQHLNRNDNAASLRF